MLLPEEVAEAEVSSAALDGCRSRIGLNWTEGQTMPGGHVGDCREGPSGAGNFVLLVRGVSVLTRQPDFLVSATVCLAFVSQVSLIRVAWLSGLCGVIVAAAMMERCCDDR